MITISRKENEAIIINDDIIITVIEISDDEVRLEIQHPEEVSIHPGEVFAAIHRGTDESDVS